MTNKYIAFEGLDGSGKTTQSEMLVKKLEELGEKVIWTREPGSPHIGFNVRDLLLDKDKKISPNALELLFQADRAEHTTWIKEKLAEGYWIISDRCYISGLAYAMSHGHSFEQLNKILEFSIKCKPRLVVVMDVSPETSVDRVIAKGSNTREEARGLKVRHEIRNNFHSIIHSSSNKNPSAFFIVDAETLTINDTHELICKVVGI